MGFYIGDSRTPLKEPLIIELGGIPFDYEITDWGMIPDNMVPIIIVTNPTFEAAGIAFCEDEYALFTRPGDMRSKQGYLLPKEVVIQQCPSVGKYLEK